jgi:general secretion pathway protein A
MGQENSVQYLQHYGFGRPPFRLSPDPECFFPSQTHQAAEKIITHAILSGEGFMVLSGQAGLGKTLLLRRILHNTASRKLPILILSPDVDSEGLLHLLLDAIGVKHPVDANLAHLVQLFQEAMLDMAAGQSLELFIMVDEAQNMPLKTMEQLRMLSNLETSQRKLMQIILVGQLELETLLADPRLGQLAQRIVVHERLEPLNREEVSHYVSYRLHRAGRPDLRLSPAAEKLLTKASGGIPRLINRIMDRTLLLAAVEQPTRFEVSHVREALETINNLTWRSSTRKRLLLGTALLLVLVLIGAGVWAMFGDKAQSQFSLTAPAADEAIHSTLFTGRGAPQC